MDKNEFDWGDNWALLALSAMAASMNNPDTPEEPPMLPMRTPETMHFNDTGWNIVNIDKFTIEQLRAAARNKKLRQDMLRNDFDENVKEYIKRRDAAVLVAIRDDNIEPLRALTYETKGKLPDSDEVMWAIAHKLCCNITSMPQELKDKSRKWLEEHGFKAEIW